MDETSQLAHFEETMVPHLKAAYNLAAWLVRNPHDAEDLVQESYIRAFRYFGGFRGGDGRAWLLAVVRNTCLTWLRQRGTGSPMQVFDERVHGSPDAGSNPEARLLTQTDAAQLRACIDALPAEYREALVLREFEELPYKEIAEVTAVPIGTIMSRLSRARKRLLDCLGSVGGAR